MSRTALPVRDMVVSTLKCCYQIKGKMIVRTVFMYQLRQEHRGFPIAQLFTRLYYLTFISANCHCLHRRDVEDELLGSLAIQSQDRKEERVFDLVQSKQFVSRSTSFEDVCSVVPASIIGCICIVGHWILRR